MKKILDALFAAWTVVVVIGLFCGLFVVLAWIGLSNIMLGLIAAFIMVLALGNASR